MSEIIFGQYNVRNKFAKFSCLCRNLNVAQALIDAITIH